MGQDSMMKAKVRDLFAARRALQMVANEKLPIKVAYFLGRLGVEVDRQMKVVEKQRLAIFEELGEKVFEKDKDGNVVKDADGNEKWSGSMAIKAENQEEFAKRDEELQDAPAEIALFPLPLSRFNEVPMTPQVMHDLMPFLTED